MTKQPSPSKASEKAPKSASEKVCKFINSTGDFRVSAVVATRVVDEMRSILHTYPIATVALGRALVGSILMAAHQKEGHSVGMYFRGNGPLGVIFAESTYDGASRAYTVHPQLQLPPKKNGLDISGAIGHGLLEVVRGSASTNQLHTGTVIIKTGEIGEDIAYYLQQSQQIPSAVALGVEVDMYGKVLGAGGLLVELFPGAKKTVIQKIEISLKSAGSLSNMITKGASAHDLVHAFITGFELEEIEHNYSIRYECRCNLDKVKNALMLLGVQEIEHLISKKEPAHATCDFCGRQYTISLDELDELRKQSVRRSMN